MNKISFSYERMGTKPRFEKEAKVIRKCPIDFTCDTLFCDETWENVYWGLSFCSRDILLPHLRDFLYSKITLHQVRKVHRDNNNENKHR